MHANGLVIGQYIKSAEFGNTLPAEPTFTIKGDSIEDVPSLKPGAAEGKTVPKGIVYFEEIPRGWVMGKTNVECLKALFGSETEDWRGKRVTLFCDKTVRPEPGIRVKGSPDITAPVKAVVKLPKRAPITMTLVPTGNAGPMPLDHFKGWLTDAVKTKGWTEAQVKALLGCPAAEVPAEDRRSIVARLKEGPPRDDAPPSDDAPPNE